MASLGLKIVSGEFNPVQPPPEQTLGMTNYINVPFFNSDSNYTIINRIGGLSYNRLRHLTVNDFIFDCSPNNLYDVEFDINTTLIKITDIGIYNPNTNTYISSSAYGIVFRKNDWSALSAGNVIAFNTLANDVKGVFGQVPYSSINFSIEQAISANNDFYYLKYEILNSSSQYSQYYHILKFSCFGHRLKNGYHGTTNSTFKVPHFPTVSPIKYNDILEKSNWTFYNESGLVVTDAIFDADIAFYPVLNNVFPWIYPQINNYKGKYISKVYFLGWSNNGNEYTMEELTSLTFNGESLKHFQSIPMYQLLSEALLFNSEDYSLNFGNIENLKIYVGIEDYLTGQIYTFDMVSI